MDDNTQQQNQSNDQQGDDQMNYASAGSIETGPIPIKQESSPQQVEYGNEVLRQIDNSSEHALEAAERKEVKREDQTKQQQVQTQQQQKTVSTPPANQPKYFGYNIPPQVVNNPQKIKDNAGKGDPSVSGTWVYMLLDRMLKMRS